jgi:hypothetical protein
VTVKLVAIVVTTEPAWLGVAKAELASNPAAKASKSVRFMITLSYFQVITFHLGCCA